MHMVAMYRHRYYVVTHKRVNDVTNFNRRKIQRFNQTMLERSNPNCDIPIHIALTFL